MSFFEEVADNILNDELEDARRGPVTKLAPTKIHEFSMVTSNINSAEQFYILEMILPVVSVGPPALSVSIFLM